MAKALSPETPIEELSTSDELLAFANDYEFENIRELLKPGLTELHKYQGFDYRLQREIISLVQNNHWESLLETA